jgi:hypothetical protein
VLFGLALVAHHHLKVQADVLIKLLRACSFAPVRRDADPADSWPAAVSERFDTCWLAGDHHNLYIALSQRVAR